MTRLKALLFHPYDLPLRHEWTTAQGAVARRRGWVAEARTDDGARGFGDCPRDAPGHDGLGADAASLDDFARTLVGVPLEDILSGPVSVPGVAAAAVECAVLDATARALGTPLRLLLDDRAAGSIAVNAVAALGVLKERAGAGFRTIKLKVGIRPVADEVAALRAALIPEGVALRLDANRAWTPDQAARFLDGVASLPVESVEEPLTAPSLDSLAALQKRTGIVLALDESLPGLGTEAVLEAAPVRRLVLKLGAVGGLAATLALARKAAVAGMDCVVTSRLDSAVGVLAAAHLAAAVEGGRKRGQRGLAHGLATSEWLAEDVCEPPHIRRGRLRFGRRPGLGLDVWLS